MKQDECFVRSWGSRKKGFEEESKYLAAGDWAHHYSCAAPRVPQLKADGERGAVMERGERYVRNVRSPSLQAPGKSCGDEQPMETPRASRGICRGAVQLTGEKRGFMLCGLVGAREETVKPGWTWIVSLGSVCS